MFGIELGIGIWCVIQVALDCGGDGERDRDVYCCRDCDCDGGSDDNCGFD